MFFPIQQSVDEILKHKISRTDFYLTQGKCVYKCWTRLSVAFSDGCLWRLLEPYSLHLLTGNFLMKFRKWKWIEKISINLQKMFGIRLIQTESSVSMEGHFLLDGDLAQDVTVGTPAIRMKTSESSGPEFDQRIWVKPRNACKWVCFQSWKPCVRGQTLFTRHRPHTSYWLNTQTWYLRST